MKFVVINQNGGGELTHYGVKGMKWGVRKEYIPHPRISDNKDLENKKKRFKLSKSQKIALGVSGAIIAGGLSYVAYRKIGLDYVGGILKAGTTLQTITTSENIDYGKRFYAAYTNKDKNLYKKSMPMHYSQFKKGRIYSAESIVSKSIKYPSNKQAEKIYNNLKKSSVGFKALVGEMGYDDFNTNLSGQVSPQDKIFFSELKKKGFSAIIDVNDQKGMGFKSDRPLIVFDSENLTRGMIKEISNLEILDDRALRKLREVGRKEVSNAAMRRLIKDDAGKISSFVGAYIGVSALENSEKKKSKTIKMRRKPNER